jgi:CHAT domain-containing protein
VSERARAAAAGLPSIPALSLAELQQRLAGTGVTLLELVALEDEIVAFVITAANVEIARRPAVRSELAALATAATAGDATAARTLYDLAIRPARRTIDTAASLIVVPDGWLEEVPFAALQDEAGHYLVEVAPLAIASRSASLTRRPARMTAPRLAAITLPAGRTLETLPETEREIAEIGALYRSVQVVPASQATFGAFVTASAHADVVHIAGHTTRQKGGGDPALVFDEGQRAAWSDIVSRFGARPDVVLLSACETLRRSHTPQARTLSLGAAFLTAGAAEVVGTLAQINDRDALALFRAVHEQIAAGAGAAVALRRVQMDAIDAEKSGGVPAGWRTVAVLTSRLPDNGRKQ